MLYFFVFFVILILQHNFIFILFWGDFMRVTISISDEMNEKLGFYSQKMCMSRSQLINFLTGQGLMSLDKSMSILESMGETVSQDLIDNSLKTLSK